MTKKPFGFTGVAVPVIGQGTWNIEGSREQERRAVEMRFGLGDREPAVMRVISEELGLPEHRVRELINRALERLSQLLADVEELRAA